MHTVALPHLPIPGVSDARKTGTSPLRTVEFDGTNFVSRPQSIGEIDYRDVLTGRMPVPIEFLKDDPGTWA